MGTKKKVDPAYRRCPVCGEGFVQHGGPGRKRTYCQAACRRKAQRQRDVQLGDGAAASLGRQVAEQLHALAARLVDAEYQGASLPVLMGWAEALEREVRAYGAAAVHDARAGGWGWEAVAGAAGVSADAARSRWSESKVRRLFAHRAQEEQVHSRGRPAPTVEGVLAASAAAREGTASPAAQAGGTLAAALSCLQRRSGVTLQDAARQADVSASYISRVLSGERVPSWPVVHMLATIFGGEAEEMRTLWESAHGVTRPVRKGVPAAAGRLHAALRGLYLAAQCPGEECVSEAAGALSPETVADVLAGELVPRWPEMALLVRALGGCPADIRPLWEEVHYAFLVSHDVFPPAGLSRSGLPSAGAEE
ncbi:helix-turn-helix domain-containing protein [Streptomyces sp. NPDC054796]